MRAVTYQEPGRIAVEDRPEPELQDPSDAIVKIDAAGICGSDLHVYHATHREVEKGFIIGHEYVGTVLAVGDGVTELAEGDRVLGSFFSSCGRCFQCRRALYSQCENLRVFGFGSALGNLAGTQAEQALVPNAHLTLRKVSPALSEAAALFAGDVMSTAYHSVLQGDLKPGQSCAVVGLGPIGLCAVMAAKAAGATPVLAFDSVDDRLEVARGLGAHPVHFQEEDVDAVVSDHTNGRGVDVAIEAVGHPAALDLASRVCRKSATISVVGIHSGTIEIAIGQIFGKNITVKTGRANVIGNLDEVLALLEAGVLDPAPLVSREMSLEDAPEAYAAFDRREALKILLRP